MLNNKFWQAFFAIAPIVSFILIFAGYFVFIFSILGNIEAFEHNDGTPPMEFFGRLGFFFLMIFLTIFICLGSLVFYIVHAVKNPNLKENNLLLVWVILFVFVGGISQFIYWIIEIIGKRDSGQITH